MSEITDDYLGDSDVRRWTTTAKAAKLSGSGEQGGLAWIVTEFPDDMIDSDLASAEASGAPTLRASTDRFGINQIAIKVNKFAPASGGISGGARARVRLDPGTYQGGASFPVTFFWIPGGSQTQPAAGATYGANNVYTDYGAAWEFEDDPANGPIDQTGNGNTGAASGSMSAADQIDFKYETGIDFDGVNDAIQVVDDDTIDFDPAKGLSLGFWIDEVSQSGWRTYMGKRQNGITDPTASYIINKNEGSDIFQLSFIKSGTGYSVQVSYSANFTAGNEYHIVGTLEESGSDTILKLYKDGALLAENTITGETTGANTAPLVMGGTKYSSGSIDEECGSDMAFPFVYQGVLTVDQVATLYENERNAADFWDTTASVESGPFQLPGGGKGCVSLGVGVMI